METEQKKVIVELENLGTMNTNIVRIRKGDKCVVLTFSYETIVTVSNDYKSKTSINEWGKTTGKLLNKICPDPKQRVPHEEVLQFAEEQLQKVLYD